MSQTVLKRSTIHNLLDDISELFINTKVVDLDNIRVSQFRDGCDFLHESLSCARVDDPDWVDDLDRDFPLSPNPPKDTDGRREESGRGVRELQGK